MSLAPIPQPSRSSLVRPLIESIFDDLVKSRSLIVEGFETKSPLYAVVFPWCIKQESEEYSSDKERQRLEALGFDGEKIVKSLSDILHDDSHLRKCCITEYRLAQTLDFFVGATMESTGSSLLSEINFDPLVDQFLDRIYVAPFKAQTFSHLFNFTSDVSDLEFGPLQIVELPERDIAELLGEYTGYSLLHPRNAGRFFLRAETDEEITEDWQWVFSEFGNAQNFVRLLQYYQDGIVHVNYTSPLFSPGWVNIIRKPGGFPIGPHRKVPYDEGRRPFFFRQQDYEDLLFRFTFFEQPEIDRLFGQVRNPLGEVIGFAGYYFEACHTQIEVERSLVDLAIAFEALFHPANEGELTFRMSQLCGQFVGETQTEKQEVFSQMKDMYGRRSKLLHGSPKAHEPDFLSIDDIERWMSIIRRAMTKFTILYLRGEKEHKAIINQIQQSIFDPQSRRELRQKSDLGRFESEFTKEIENRGA